MVKKHEYQGRWNPKRQKPPKEIRMKIHDSKRQDGRLMMKNKLKDFIHNGEPIPSELRNSESGFLLTKIAGEYLDNGDTVRAMIALMESKKCHEGET